MASRQSLYYGGLSTPPPARGTSFDQFNGSASGMGQPYGSSTFIKSPQQYYRPSPPSGSSSPFTSTNPLSPGSFNFQPQSTLYSQKKSPDSFEPMNTSPITQQQSRLSPSPSKLSPGGGGSGYFLPSYLTGEPTGSFLSHSPPLGRSTSMRDFGSPKGHTKNVLFDTSSKYSSTEAGTGGGISGAPAGQAKSTGPPVFGLGNLDDDNKVPPRSSSSRVIGKDQYSDGAGGANGDLVNNFNPSNIRSIISQKKTLQQTGLSPISSTGMAQSQLPSSPPTPPTLSNWVTVFGFPITATAYVISHFSEFGTIVDTKSVAGSNWVHLKYSNKFEARKALNKNGTLIGGNMMIGVLSYNIDEDDDEPLVKKTLPDSNTLVQITPLAGGLGPSGTSSATTTSASKTNNVQPTPSNGEMIQDVKSRLRPLARTGYMGTNPLPKESNGIVSRTLEFLFGW